MPYHPVTVFGGSGFVGRQIVKRLADDGAEVRVAVRRPERASFLTQSIDGDLRLAVSSSSDCSVQQQPTFYKALVGGNPNLAPQI
jgi:NADH dehydrogenase